MPEQVLRSAYVRQPLADDAESLQPVRQVHTKPMAGVVAVTWDSVSNNDRARRSLLSSALSFSLRLADDTYRKILHKRLGEKQKADPKKWGCGSRRDSATAVTAFP